MDDSTSEPPPVAPEPAEPDQPSGDTGSLAPVALGLGIGGLLLGLIPFYGSFFALPLTIVAVVLGLTARGRPNESRAQATGGLVTGGLGLLAVIGWGVWLALGQLGFTTFSSETSVSVGSSGSMSAPTAVEVVPGEPHEPPPEDGGPAIATPPDLDGQLLNGLSGEAELSVAGQQVTLELTDCTLAEPAGGELLLRADGPDGRIAAAQPDHFGLVVLDVEVDDGPHGTYVGSLTGMSSSGSSGGLLRDRHQFSIDGQLHELHTGEVVDIDLTATCS